MPAPRSPAWTARCPTARRRVFRPALGSRLSVRDNPAARDLVRHAFADVAGNGNRARSWGKAARRWPTAPSPATLTTLAAIEAPLLLLWAREDRRHPLALAEEALERCPTASSACCRAPAS